MAPASMNADYFRTVFDYGYWARDRLFAAMDGLTDEEYARPNGFTYGSIRAVLTHCLSAEAGWFSSLRGLPRDRSVTEESLPTLEALKSRWRDEERKVRAYLAGLDDLGLAAGFMARRHVESLTVRVWQVLAHVANHGTQHRSEAAEMLTAVGRSPGDLDLMDYFLERRQTDPS